MASNEALQYKRSMFINDFYPLTIANKDRAVSGYKKNPVIL